MRRCAAHRPIATCEPTPGSRLRGKLPLASPRAHRRRPTVREAKGLDHPIDVCREARPLVAAVQVDRSRVVAGDVEEGHDTMPVTGDAACAGTRTNMAMSQCRYGG